LKFSEPVLDSDIAIFYFDYHSIFGWVGSDGRSKKGEYTLIFLIAAQACEIVEKDQNKFVTGLIEHL
jgi:hypothetical protein